MILASFSFLIFAAATALSYFVIPQKYRWVLLLISSYVFYYLVGKHLPVYILITSILTYVSALLIGHIDNRQKLFFGEHKEMTRDEKMLQRHKNDLKKKAVLTITLCFNIGILVFFKYRGLFPGVFNKFDVFSELIVPLGISYYTFQSVGYLIDVYRGTFPPNKNIGKLFLFIAYFPQIVQGPIGKYSDLSPSLFKGHTFSFDRLKNGILLMLIGLFKKIVLATYLGNIVDSVYGNYQHYDGFQILVAIALFGIRLYFDFSGYMDIVSGFSKILGIELARNFDKPFTSKSVAEFWRRWHMSLGAWFKDYLFYPLLRSGWSLKLQKNLTVKRSRAFASKVSNVIALIVLWTIIGLWHGGSLNFLYYGLAYGLIMTADFLLKPVFEKINKNLHLRDESAVWNAVRCIRVYIINSLLWIMFNFRSMSVATAIFVKAVTSPIPRSFSPSYFMPELGVYGILGFALTVILVIVFLVMQIKGYNSREFTDTVVQKKSWIVQALIAVSLIILTVYMRECTLATVGGFIYEQF